MYLRSRPRLKNFIAVLSFFAVMLFSIPITASAQCTSGGEGASSCSTSGTYSVMVMAVSIEIAYEHSVSCGDGYYACCNAAGASCIES